MGGIGKPCIAWGKTPSGGSGKFGGKKGAPGGGGNPYGCGCWPGGNGGTDPTPGLGGPPKLGSISSRDDDVRWLDE